MISASLISDKRASITDQIWIVVVASLLYFPFLGGLNLFDWDEINFAEMAREMLVLKDYLHLHINFQPFYEKPPLFIWMQALSMKIFGVNEYAARFPNAVCGLVTHLVVYHIGCKIYHRRIGLLWTSIYAGTILPHWYFKSGIIDPWFNLFIFLGIYFLIRYYWHSQLILQTKTTNAFYYLCWASLFTGLGILTKGPVAFLITGIVLAVYWVYVRFKFYISPWVFILYTFGALAVVGIWLVVEVSNNGWLFIREFLIRNYELFSTPDAGHKGFVGYHFIVFLLGAFPASVFALRAMGKLHLEQAHEKNFKIWMVILFWVVILLFSAVQSKIIHYSSLTYLPLTFLAALTIEQMITHHISFQKWMSWSLLFLGLLLSVVVIAVPFVGKSTGQIIPYIQDVFSQENLKANVFWSGWESFVGIILLACCLWGIWLLKKQKFEMGISVLFGGTALAVQLVMYVYLNNIEGYTQRTAIDFFKKMKGKDCYILNLGYRSYAQLFYFEKPQPTNPMASEQEWLMTGSTDKPVYIITKINELEEVKTSVPDAVEFERKNGFVFLKRR